MAKILYEIFSQYPTGATNGGPEEYEFVLDSQTPPNISWPKHLDLSSLQDNKMSYPDAITIVTSPTPRVGTKCCQVKIAANEPGTYKANRPRAELVRSSNEGIFAEQVWFAKRWYAVSYYIPSTFNFAAVGSWLGVMNLHNAIIHPLFAGAQPFDMWILGNQKWRLKTANSYDTSFAQTDLTDPIHLDEWEDFLLELVWDPFEAGDGPGPGGGTGYLKVYRNGALVWERTAPMGFKEDYNAGNKPPLFKFGLQISPTSPAGLFPLKHFIGFVAIGDELETLQSMSPGFSQGQDTLSSLGFSLATGSYPAPQTITLTGINNVDGESPTTGATAYYSINRAPFIEYSSGILLDAAGVFNIEAYQSKSGFDDSAMSSANYTINQDQASIPLRLECGRVSGPIPPGWSYDSYYSGQNVNAYTTTAAISGVPSGYTQAEFQSVRYSSGTQGALRFDIPVPNGTFELRLALCEVHVTASYRYKCNPNGLGTSGWTHLGTEDNYDVLNPEATVGRNTAFVVTRQITITTGLLSLVFSYHDDTGALSTAGIELLDIISPNEQIVAKILL